MRMLLLAGACLLAGCGERVVDHTTYVFTGHVAEAPTAPSNSQCTVRVTGADGPFLASIKRVNDSQEETTDFRTCLQLKPGDVVYYELSDNGAVTLRFVH